MLNFRLSSLSKTNRIVTFTKTRVSIVKVPESPLENEKSICCILLENFNVCYVTKYQQGNRARMRRLEQVIIWLLIESFPSLSNVGENNILPAFICIPSYLKYYEKFF